MATQLEREFANGPWVAECQRCKGFIHEDDPCLPEYCASCWGEIIREYVQAESDMAVCVVCNGTAVERTGEGRADWRYCHGCNGSGIVECDEAAEVGRS